MIHSQLSNDLNITLHSVQARIDVSAPFLNCQIDWTQSSFLWYNLVSVWLISVYCKHLIIGGVRILTAYSTNVMVQVLVQVLLLYVVWLWSICW